jgi:hypothetical protein
VSVVGGIKVLQGRQVFIPTHHASRAAKSRSLHSAFAAANTAAERHADAPVGMTK